MLHFLSVSELAAPSEGLLLFSKETAADVGKGEGATIRWGDKPDEKMDAKREEDRQECAAKIAAAMQAKEGQDAAAAVLEKSRQDEPLQDLQCGPLAVVGNRPSAFYIESTGKCFRRL